LPTSSHIRVPTARFPCFGHNVGRHAQVAEKNGDRVDPRHLLDAIHQSKIVVKQIDRQDRTDDPLIGVTQRIHPGQSQTGRPLSGIKGLRCGHRSLDHRDEGLLIQTDLRQKLLRYDFRSCLRLSRLEDFLNDWQSTPFAMRLRGHQFPPLGENPSDDRTSFIVQDSDKMRATEGKDGDFIGDLLVDDPQSVGISSRCGRQPLDDPGVQRQTVADRLYLFQLHLVEGLCQVDVTGHKIRFRRGEIGTDYP